jgi:hypothetical protein
VAQACCSATASSTLCPSTTRQPYRRAIRSSCSSRSGARDSATGLATCTRQPCAPRTARPHPATTPITALAWSETPKRRRGRDPARSHGSCSAYNPHPHSHAAGPQRQDAGRADPGGPAPGSAAGLGDPRAPSQSRCTTSPSADPPGCATRDSRARRPPPAPAPRGRRGLRRCGLRGAGVAGARGVPAAVPLRAGARTLAAGLRSAAPAPRDACWELVGGCLVDAPALGCCVQHRPTTPVAGQGHLAVRGGCRWRTSFGAGAQVSGGPSRARQGRLRTHGAHTPGRRSPRPWQRCRSGAQRCTCATARRPTPSTPQAQRLPPTPQTVPYPRWAAPDRYATPALPARR